MHRITTSFITGTLLVSSIAILYPATLHPEPCTLQPAPYVCDIASGLPDLPQLPKQELRTIVFLRSTVNHVCCKMTEVLQYTNLLLNLVILLTCSFWQQGLCAQFSLLLDTPSPWKFGNTFQAAGFVHLRSKDSQFQLLHREIRLLLRAVKDGSRLCLCGVRTPAL